MHIDIPQATYKHAHINTHSHSHTYKNAHINTHTHICTLTYRKLALAAFLFMFAFRAPSTRITCVCMYVCRYVCMNVCKRLEPHRPESPVYVCMCACMCMYVCICTYVYVRIYVYVCMYVCMYFLLVLADSESRPLFRLGPLSCHTYIHTYIHTSCVITYFSHHLYSLLVATDSDPALSLFPEPSHITHTLNAHTRTCINNMHADPHCL